MKSNVICPYCKTEVEITWESEDANKQEEYKCYKCKKNFYFTPKKNNFLSNYYKIHITLMIIGLIISFGIFFGIQISEFLSDTDKINNDIIINDSSQTKSNITTTISNKTYPKINLTNNLKEYVVWIKYDVEGKNLDGSYFKNSSSGSGVIKSYENGVLEIYTNRHVIDCSYNDIDCYQRISENITIKLYNGKIYSVNKVLFAKYNLDLAILEINTTDKLNLPKIGNVIIGNKVTAIGYPSFSNYTLELSISEGIITTEKELLTDDGYSFKAIESNAYTYFGSSGGGLFNDKGELIGINTWGIDGKISYAISLNSLTENIFIYCNNGTYYYNDSCYKYCTINQIMGTNKNCYGPCDSFYCKSNEIYGGDLRCKDNSLILGQDNYCHKPCGSKSTYCSNPNSICYKNNCISCGNGTILWQDGSCKIITN